MDKKFIVALIFGVIGVILSFVSKDITKLGLVGTGFFIGLIPALLFQNQIQKFTDSAALKKIEKFLFPIVVTLIGFEIKFIQITSAPAYMWFFIIAMMAFTILFSWLISGKNALGAFTGIGTAVCGNSAIAALGSFCRKKVNEAAISIGVINLLSVAALVVIPGLVSIFKLSEAQAGFLAGTGVQSMALAIASGSLMGEQAEIWATLTKLTRVALLSPALLLSIQLLKNERTEKGKFIIPNYIWFFVGAVVLANLQLLPTSLLEIIKSANNWLFAGLMVVIGLQLTRKSMATSGIKALATGTAVWIFQLGLILSFLKIGGILT
ncbi:YeiH family protein [Schleiferia thermophila]|jgi:uncharacterized integral membrane protein (TIGR00698 family)|uniref:YeiH family protein n=1 Tax=Schleiferia thermophila TaxID=884107 RepID=UPI0004E68091|nr:putative sulfate exporter family transporter [Schleiferia thermophila]KFD38633.1 hypothetical protein AT05_09165 [Schleiferia thermophila str. Yellowstone]